MTAAARPFASLPAAQQTGILCNDTRFRKFAAMRCGLPGEEFSATAATEYLRTVCDIESRSVLDSEGPALDRFHALRTEFDAWIGRIGSPQ